ncbi:uncharacterized protein SAPINGB_P001353 [Magnusiomyces paraingens]|uniref:RING-type domain-containing protein n=1 Tax=Magnusiomyces paraingens TaxID=2606893 RepID=A0A5E8B7F6_9ASCO|nr:uncharacterized protein SAPINGB_P001353 [Saprochaete ingens]VVT46720.1 unnamed protein product [Saprochaete ingens]
MLSKKGKRGQVSISHLLNFSLPERPQELQRQFQHQRNSNKNNNNKAKYNIPPPDNTAHINTSCRFILDPEYEYNEILHNPDTIISLDQVLRVFCRKSTCPICLDEAKAPRMLRCGHIMCYPCFLRFLDSDPKIGNNPLSESHKKRECPFCFESIESSKITPATFLEFDENFDTPRPNNETVLRLMFRPHVNENGEEQQCMNAFPISLSEISSETLFTIPTVLETSYIYPRFMMPTREFLLGQFKKEIKDLEAQRNEEYLLYPEDKDYVGLYFNLAIKKIQVLMAEVQVGFKYDSDEIKKKQAFYLHGFSSKKPTDELEKTSEEFISQFDDNSAYFFYQTAFQSETRYVLSTLDTRILKHEFQNYHSMPSSIVVKVENVIYGNIMSPDMRKKFKYLSHFPFYTDIAFIECDWISNSKGKKNDNKTKSKESPEISTGKTDMRHSKNLLSDHQQPAVNGPLKLSSNTLNFFRKDLQQRTDNLRRKNKKEKDQARRFQNMQERKLYNDLLSSSGLVYESGNPSSTEYQESFSSSVSFPSLGSNKSIMKTTDDAPIGNSSNMSDSSPKENVDNSNTAESLPSSGNAPLFKKKTVWGTEAVVFKSTIEEELNARNRAGLNEGWLDYNTLMKHSSSNNDDPSSTSKETSNSSKGKRKGKKLVLMSTARAMY